MMQGHNSKSKFIITHQEHEQQQHQQKQQALAPESVSSDNVLSVFNNMGAPGLSVRETTLVSDEGRIGFARSVHSGRLETSDVFAVIVGVVVIALKICRSADVFAIELDPSLVATPPAIAAVPLLPGSWESIQPVAFPLARVN